MSGRLKIGEAPQGTRSSRWCGTKRNVSAPSVSSLVPLRCVVVSQIQRSAAAPPRRDPRHWHGGYPIRRAGDISGIHETTRFANRLNVGIDEHGGDHRGRGGVRTIGRGVRRPSARGDARLPRGWPHPARRRTWGRGRHFGAEREQASQILLDGGVLTVWSPGRFRYYRIADEQAAAVIEALASLAARPNHHGRGRRLPPDLLCTALLRAFGGLARRCPGVRVGTERLHLPIATGHRDDRNGASMAR
jgi:hypothetical protein